MFVFANLLNAIALLLRSVAQFYAFVLIGYVIVSWVNADPMNPIVRFIRALTDPVLSRIRRFVPPIAGLDFSVLIALLFVQIVVSGFIVPTLFDSAHSIR